MRAAVGVESILVGNSVSLQLKVYEAEIKPLRKEYKRLLPDVTKKNLFEEVKTRASSPVKKGSCDFDRSFCGMSGWHC